MKQKTASAATNQTANSGARKPRMAFAIATGFGLGYLPLAPGTWGSLLGVVLGWLALESSWASTATDRIFLPSAASTALSARTFAQTEVAFAVLFSLAGVWAADRVERYLRKEDPQIVVVDEIAGQLIAYVGLATPRTFSLNWKYLLLGFILFRVFDVWKPFPARQAESLPGGLGIMADDWMAGAYAALALWLIRMLVH